MLRASAWRAPPRYRLSLSNPMETTLPSSEQTVEPGGEMDQ